MTRDLAELAHELSMLCRGCRRKLVLMSDKLEAEMTGGLCPDCVGHPDRRGGTG